MSVTEALEYVTENDVKFIRLAFCDIFGVQKNISIMPNALPRAFEFGIPLNAAMLGGVDFQAESSLFLVPDPKTISVLPWRPKQGRVVRFFCDIKNADGTPFIGDVRNILKQSVKRITDMGYRCFSGADCEFYLFKTSENGEPTFTPYDSAGYCDIGPFDKCENIRRAICLALEEMGIVPECSHHESGFGQNEIDFCNADPLTTAEHLITLRSVVKAIAAVNGAFASFLPRPAESLERSSLHLNISLFEKGQNIFKSAGSEQSDVVKKFIAGIMDKIDRITLFLNPLKTSYDWNAPSFSSDETFKNWPVCWASDNYSQLIRIPAVRGEYSSMEIRSPDSSCNPYLAFALLLQAGADGIEENMPIKEPVNINRVMMKEECFTDYKMLPSNHLEAVKAAQSSDFVKRVLPEMIISAYIKRISSDCLPKEEIAGLFEAM